MSSDGFFSDKVKPGTPEDVKKLQGNKKKPKDDSVDFIADWERELRASQETSGTTPRRGRPRKPQGTQRTKKTITRGSADSPKTVSFDFDIGDTSW